MQKTGIFSQILLFKYSYLVSTFTDTIRKFMKIGCVDGAHT